jgi:hypothetical protein
MTTTEQLDQQHLATWRAQNYPLLRISIELQGLRRDTPASLAYLLEELASRLRAGETIGESSDDDVGYRFTTSTSPKSLFGDAPSSHR